MQHFPPFQPLTYELLEGADFSKPRTVKKILGDLHARLKKVKTREDLVSWLQLHDEVQDAAWEQSIELEIEHTADTKNKAVKDAYNHQISKVDPVWEEAYYPILVRLSRKTAFKELPKEYNLFRQTIYSMLRGSTAKNSALQGKETRLAGEYDDVVTQLTVSVDGEKVTPTACGICWKGPTAGSARKPGKRNRRSAWPIADSSTRFSAARSICANSRRRTPASPSTRKTAARRETTSASTFRRKRPATRRRTSRRSTRPSRTTWSPSSGPTRKTGASGSSPTGSCAPARKCAPGT